MLKNIKTAKLLFSTIAYMLFIFVMSSIPGKNASIKDFFIFKPDITNILHIPVFGLVFVLWYRSLKQFNFISRNCYLYAIAISLLYGIFIEIHQINVPGRFASLQDILLDAIGVGTGVVFAYKTS